VGKTTCAGAAALNLAEAHPDRRFRLVSVDPAHSLEDCFAGEQNALPANLAVTELDARAGLADFVSRHGRDLRQIALRGTFLDEEDVGRLLDLSVPGLDEVMALKELSRLVSEEPDLHLIVDTAPSGHALRLLGLPGLAGRWLDALDALLAKHRFLRERYTGSSAEDEVDTFLRGLREAFGRLGRLLRDPFRCRFVPVLHAEPLSRDETGRLVKALEALRVPLADVLVNGLYPPDGPCPVCRDVYRRQREVARGLREALGGCALWEVPQQGAEVRGLAGLRRFWDGVRPLRADKAVTADEAAATPASLAPRVERPVPLPGPAERLILLGGKGGVGKTTLAAATALRLAEARADRQVFLVSTDPAHSLSDGLRRPIAARGTPVAPRLTAMEIDAEAEFTALRDLYREELQRLWDRLLADHEGADLPFEREALDRLLDLSPPGLDELTAVTRIVDLLEAEKRWRVVLDTAATGHLLRMLQTPDLVRSWLREVLRLLLRYKRLIRLPRLSDFLLDLSRRITRLRSLITGEGARLTAVALPTRMALEETRDLVAACRDLGIRVPALLLNRATPPGRCPHCRELFRAEATVRKAYAHAFPRLPQGTVFYAGDLRGSDRLAALGRALYRD